MTQIRYFYLQYYKHNKTILKQMPRAAINY